jgi:hypothetical protein
MGRANIRGNFDYVIWHSRDRCARLRLRFVRLAGWETSNECEEDLDDRRGAVDRTGHRSDRGL